MVACTCSVRWNCVSIPTVCMYVEPTGPSSVFGCAVAQHQHHDEHTAVRVHLHVSYKVNNTDVLPDATDILPRYLVERKGESV